MNFVWTALLYRDLVKEAVKKATFMACFLCLLTSVGCVLTNPTNAYRPVRHYGGGRRGSAAARPSAQHVEGPLNLRQAIDIALANNPEIAAAEWDAQSARFKRDVACGVMWPSLHAVGGYSRHLNDQRLVPAQKNGQRGVFSSDIFSSELVATLPLFAGGRIRSEVGAAELLHEAAKHRLSRSREELVFNVSSVFFEILAQRHVLKSLEFSRKALNEHLKQVDDLIANQKAARVDRLRTQVRLADLEQELLREKNLLAIEKRALAGLLGVQNSKSPIDVSGTLAAVENIGKLNLEESLLTAYGRRADYLAARSALEAQAKNVDAARAGYWPTLSLKGTYGGRWAANPADRPSGVSDLEDVGSVGIVLDIPLFEGGSISARVRQQRAELAAAQERLRKLELQIRLEVEMALLNVTSSQERVSAIEKAIEQAKESLRIERQKYDLGKGSVSDVLDAQSALLDSQTNYYRALAAYNTSVAQWRLATGEEQ